MAVQLANGAQIWLEATKSALRPPPDITLSEWSDRYRVLNQTSSAEPGDWRTSRVPFMREIMDTMSPQSPVEQVWVMKGAQVSWTEVLNNMLGYVAHIHPAPTMFVQPTLSLIKRHVKMRIDPMVADVPVVRERIPPARKRDSNNTALMKQFPGGVWIFVGANSATDMRSAPVRFLLPDEIDGYPLDVGDEGDPLELQINRTKTFFRRKIIGGSTPTVRDISRIEKRFKTGDQRYYHVPCPHCGEKQPIRWDNIKWHKDEHGNHLPETAHLVCTECGAEIEEHHKTWMLAEENGAEWIPSNPDAPAHIRSYHISSLYSPWETWATIAEKWLAAQKDPYLLKTFANTILGETWDDEANRTEAKDLQDRAEPYPLGVVPRGGLMLVASVDTQDDRFEVQITAIGRGLEMWVIDVIVIHESPAMQVAWDKLDEVRERVYDHVCGTTLKIEAMAVDSGGHFTQEVYDYCRTRRYQGVFAVKGASQRNKPIIGRPSKQDVNVRGRTIKSGVDLWPVGTDTAKDRIFALFQLEEAGPGYLHFSDELPGDYFEQLTAEKRTVRYVKGHPISEWVKPSHARNEALDLMVYAFAALYKLGVHKYSDRDWKRLEDVVQPLNGDLFAMPAPQPEASADPQPKQENPRSPVAAASGALSNRWTNPGAGMV